MPKVSRIGKFRASAKSAANAHASTSSAKTSPSASRLNASLTPPSTKPTGEGGGSEKRNANKGGEDGESSSSSLPATTQAMSRGQRRRLAKREQYLKREEMVLRTLRLRRAESQRGRIDGLDGLRDALPPVSADAAAGVERERPGGGGGGGGSELTAANNNRARKDLMGREVSHMSLVLQHPAFKADPFSTMREHLRNTLAAQAKVQDAVHEKRRTEDAERREEDRARKKERKKELVGDRASKSRRKDSGNARRGKR